MRKTFTIVLLLMAIGLSACSESKQQAAEQSSEKPVNTTEESAVSAVEESVSEIVSNFEQEPFTDLHYSGTGDKIITDIALPQGVFVAEIAVTSGSYSSIKFHPNDDSNELVLNTTDASYKGTRLLQSSIESVENGILEIECSGSWDIVIKRLSGECGNNISGNGDTVTGWLSGADGKKIVNVAANGTGYCGIRLYELSSDTNTLHFDLLLNSTDEYNGEALGNFKSENQYFFEVTVNGDWTICFGDDPVTQYP